MIVATWIGTPSDILPLELGSCQYERGSDGRVVHYLTNPLVAQHVMIEPGWNSHSLLRFIATVSAVTVCSSLRLLLLLYAQ